MSKVSKLIRDEIFPCLFLYRDDISNILTNNNINYNDKILSFKYFSKYWKKLTPLLSSCPLKFSFRYYYHLIELQLYSLLINLNHINNNDILSNNNILDENSLIISFNSNNLNLTQCLIQNISIIYSLYIINLTQPTHYLYEEYYKNFSINFLNNLKINHHSILLNKNYSNRYKNNIKNYNVNFFNNNNNNEVNKDISNATIDGRIDSNVNEDIISNEISHIEIENIINNEDIITNNINNNNIDEENLMKNYLLNYNNNNINNNINIKLINNKNIIKIIKNIKKKLLYYLFINNNNNKINFYKKNKNFFHFLLIIFILKFFINSNIKICNIFKLTSSSSSSTSTSSNSLSFTSSNISNTNTPSSSPSLSNSNSLPIFSSLDDFDLESSEYDLEDDSDFASNSSFQQEIYRLPFQINKLNYEKLSITIQYLIEFLTSSSSSNNNELIDKLNNILNNFLITFYNNSLNSNLLNYFLLFLPSIFDPILFFYDLNFNSQFIIVKDIYDQIDEDKKENISTNPPPTSSDSSNTSTSIPVSSSLSSNSTSDFTTSNQYISSPATRYSSTYLFEKFHYEPNTIVNPLDYDESSLVITNNFDINKSIIKLLISIPSASSINIIPYLRQSRKLSDETRKENEEFEGNVDVNQENVEEYQIDSNIKNKNKSIIFDNIKKRKKLLQDEENNTTNRLRLIRLLIKQLKLRRKIYKDLSNFQDNLLHIINMLKSSNKNNISSTFFSFLSDISTENIPNDDNSLAQPYPSSPNFTSSQSVENLSEPNSSYSSILSEEDFNILRSLEEETNSMLNIIRSDTEHPISSSSTKSTKKSTQTSRPSRSITTVETNENSLLDSETLAILNQLESNTDQLLMELGNGITSSTRKKQQKKKTSSKKTTPIPTLSLPSMSSDLPDSSVLNSDDLELLRRLEENTQELFQSFNSSETIDTQNKSKAKKSKTTNTNKKKKNSLLDNESLKFLEELEASTDLLLSSYQEEEKIPERVVELTEKKTRKRKSIDSNQTSTRKKSNKKEKTIISAEDLDILEQLERNLG